MLTNKIKKNSIDPTKFVIIYVVSREFVVTDVQFFVHSNTE